MSDGAETDRRIWIRDIFPRTREFVELPRSVSADEFVDDPRRLLVRVAVDRQLDSLSVALDLGDDHRGFLAAGFIRPALEELFWLMYLAELLKNLQRRSLT